MSIALCRRQLHRGLLRSTRNQEKRGTVGGSLPSPATAPTVSFPALDEELGVARLRSNLAEAWTIASRAIASRISAGLGDYVHIRSGLPPLSPATGVSTVTPPHH